MYPVVLFRSSKVSVWPAEPRKDDVLGASTSCGHRRAFEVWFMNCPFVGSSVKLRKRLDVVAYGSSSRSISEWLRVLIDNTSDDGRRLRAAPVSHDLALYASGMSDLDDWVDVADAVRAWSLEKSLVSPTTCSKLPQPD